MTISENPAPRKIFNYLKIEHASNPYKKTNLTILEKTVNNILIFSFLIIFQKLLIFDSPKTLLFVYFYLGGSKKHYFISPFYISIDSGISRQFYESKIQIFIFMKIGPMSRTECFCPTFRCS